MNNAAAADYATQPAGHKNSDYEMLGQLPVVFKAQCPVSSLAKLQKVSGECESYGRSVDK